MRSKGWTALVYVAAAGLSLPAHAASKSDEEWRKVAVTVQPLLWVLGYYSGAFEFALSDKMSLAAGLNVTAFTVGTSTSFPSGPGGATSTFSASQTVFSVGVQPGLSFFLVGRAPEGLWIGPRVEVAYLAVTNASKSTGGSFPSESSSTTSGLVYGGHVMAGYNTVMANGLMLQVGLGLGFAATSLSTSSSAGGPSSSPFGVAASFGRVSFGVGWAF